MCPSAPKPKSKSSPSSINRSSGRRQWQEQKSEETRTAIFDAAMECFIEFGYAKTSIPLIADIAGMSRGAILHHFPTRHSLLVAVVEFLHEKRLKEYKELMADVDRPSEDLTLDRQLKGVDAAWQHVNLPSFVTYHELLSAARTDDELWKVMAPLEIKFEEEFENLAKEVFPHWCDLNELTLANDMTLFLLKGMALSPIQKNKSERIQAVLQRLAKVVEDIYEEAVDASK